ncbi:hypothetical protein B6I21_07880 [candidate division KSB1 bacterium 4572_119]|nr:MAG: hypothetical protein B6I21_07880 [candidate division KSB1 bacterium 4572_119]
MKFFSSEIYYPSLFLLIFIILLSSYNQSLTANPPQIKIGLDVLMEEKLELISGKKVGVITNQTGIDSKGNHVIDLLFEAPGVELTALFGPEHGIRGDVEGGFKIKTNVDAKTGVPIFSIYGKTKKPTPQMLENIDVLIFDIQDVGTRFYTYISTMSLCMEAAAENNIQFLVLDRPNPITGTMVEGPVLDEEYKSFVGIHPIALRHGMTVGELAKMFNDEGWLANGVKADLKVIKMKNWRRDSWYDELGLKWIKPSPNMPSATAALLYPGMGLLETTNISEGRGTELPFINVGAPWINNSKLKQILDNADIPGIRVDTTSYIPVDMPGAAMNPKFEGQLCRGLKLFITDPLKFPSVTFGLFLISAVQKNHFDEFQWRSPRSPLIMFGNNETPSAIENGEPPKKIIQSWQEKLDKFIQKRKRYLLYE